MMDNNGNWRPSQGRSGAGGDAPPVGDFDWRAEFCPTSRDKIIDKILETLKKCLPISGPEGLNELQKNAVRLEEEIYHVASSEPDYIRRISLKMLTMETRSQNTTPNAMTSNSDVRITEPSNTDLTNGVANLNIEATSSRFNK